jgi:transcriptional regulator with XRE-family HTH domain
MSQEELAERAGLSVRTVRRLEADMSIRPRPRTVRSLIRALGVASADLSAEAQRDHHANLVDESRE